MIITIIIIIKIVVVQKVQNKNTHKLKTLKKPSKRHHDVGLLILILDRRSAY